jgi:hypothetical protein
VEVGLVVVVLGVVVEGVACEFGVVAVLFGVVVAPEEVEPGVMVPVEFEDCGTADPLAGTQFAPLAVLEVLGVVLVEELGVDVADPEELGKVLLLVLGAVLLAEEALGVVEEVELVVDPAALALVLGTMPGGQLFVGELDELGVVEVLGVVVEVPVCDVGVVAVPDCEAGADVDGVVVVEFVVVDVVCAATHVAPAVRINTNVNFFMFSVLVKSSGYIAMPTFRAGCAATGQKKGPVSAGPGLSAIVECDRGYLSVALAAEPRAQAHRSRAQ